MKQFFCGLVNELPDGVDFLIGNDIWHRSHSFPDDVINQAVLTRQAAARNTQKVYDDDSHDAQTHHADDDKNLPFGAPLYTEIDLASITDRKQLISLQKYDPNL